MALIDNSTTYTGTDLDGFYSTALLTGNSKSTFRKLLNVKSKTKVASLDLGSFLQADACSLSASGSYTLDQKEVEVCPLAYKIALCILDWEGTYLSEKMAAGANSQSFPSGVVEYIMNLVAEGTSKETERLCWAGDIAASPPDLCDGLQKQFLADAAVVDVAVDGTKLHAASTVVAELTRMYNAISNTIRNKGKIVWYVNPATAAAYKLALVSTNPALVGINQGNYSLNFLGIPMIIAEGLGAYKSVIAEPMNLWYACDLTSDSENTASLVFDPTNPKTAYAMGSFKFAVSYGVGAEIVYYN